MNVIADKKFLQLCNQKLLFLPKWGWAIFGWGIIPISSLLVVCFFFVCFFLFVFFFFGGGGTFLMNNEMTNIFFMFHVWFNRRSKAHQILYLR